MYEAIYSEINNVLEIQSNLFTKIALHFLKCVEKQNYLFLMQHI